MPLDNEQWEIVNRHMTISIELCITAGMDEDEIREEFENVLENVLPGEDDNIERPLKPKKK